MAGRDHGGRRSGAAGRVDFFLFVFFGRFLRFSFLCLFVQCLDFVPWSRKLVVHCNHSRFATPQHRESPTENLELSMGFQCAIVLQVHDIVDRCTG